MDLKNETNVVRDRTVGHPHYVRFGSGWTIVSWAFALILLVSAGLKAEASWFQTPTHQPSNWLRAVDSATIFVEWAIAAWVLSGYSFVWARRAVLGLLSVFLFTAALRAIHGEKDCGCFGRIQTHPLLTMAFDAIAFLGIWYTGRHRSSHKALSNGLRAPSNPWVKLIIPIAAVACIPPITAFAASHFVTRPVIGQHVFVLDPLSWKDRSFPLLDHLDPSSCDLRNGHWLVFLVNRNCKLCREFVSHEDFEKLKQIRKTQNVQRDPVVLDLAREPAVDAFHVPAPIILVQKGETYLAEGPFEIYLDGGIVSDVRRIDEEAGRGPDAN